MPVGLQTSQRGASQIIQSSWQRCLEHGMSSRLHTEQTLLSPADMRRQHESHHQLRRLALREMHLLERVLRGTGRILLLANCDGIILDSTGDEEFLGRARKVYLQPGASWHEFRVGTNAIGTSIVERRFVRVLGKQHFLEENHFLVCNAAPIMSPTGGLAGVLDLSGVLTDSFAPADQLVKSAVAHIEHDWVTETGEYDLLVRLHQHPSWVGTPEEGMLGFRDDLLVAASAKALTLLGLQPGAIRNAHWGDLFENRPMLGFQELHLAGRPGQYFAEISHRMASAPSRSRAGSPSGSSRPGVCWRDGAVWDSTTLPLLEKAKRAFAANVPILVQGETGTGKEVFVQMLHRTSSVADGPLVAVNTAALPDGLLEAELFGYEEGALPGSRRQRSPGLIRQADGGTLLLDEIGDMPLTLQARLLRVLQHGEVLPLGASQPVRVSFRLVATTHQNLEQAVREHRFREDLYYRLCHLRLVLPPLREREELSDILDQMLLDSGAPQRGVRLGAETRQMLMKYSWPGNLREMANVVHVLAALADDNTILEPESLPDGIRHSLHEEPQQLESIKQKAVRHAVLSEGGNMSAAARQLGVHRSTLYRRIKNARKPE